MADVFAGYGIISYYYMYGNLTRNTGILFMLLSSGLIFAGANLWESFLTEAESKEENNFRKNQHDTSTFVRGCLFCLLGLCAAMSRGMTSFIIAALLAFLLIARIFLFRKSDLCSAVLTGLVRGLNMLLGMSVYPLLEVTFHQPLPSLAALLLALYVCAVMLAVHKSLPEAGRGNLLLSILTTAAAGTAAYAVMPAGIAATSICGFGLFLIVIFGLKAIFSRFDPDGRIYSRYAMTTAIILEMAWLASYSRGWEYGIRIISLTPLAVIFIISFFSAFYYSKKPALYH
jgi:hypothetical protein